MEMGTSVSSDGKRWYERRQGRRYPVNVPLEYKIYGVGEGGARQGCEVGSGRTLNMSSAGVLFETDQTLRAGLDVDLSIAWPASLSKSVGLTLRVRGRVVRAERNRVAVTMTHYEFRTRSLS